MNIEQFDIDAMLSGDVGEWALLENERLWIQTKDRKTSFYDRCLLKAWRDLMEVRSGCVSV